MSRLQVDQVDPPGSVVNGPGPLVPGGRPSLSDVPDGGHTHQATGCHQQQRQLCFHVPWLNGSARVLETNGFIKGIEKIVVLVNQ